MCKVIIENPNEKVGFILFNHLYARDRSTFTIDELLNELKSYNITISKHQLQQEINQLINDGAVSQRVGYYKRITML